MTKKTREASSKGLGRRKVKKGKEGQKEEKAAIVTTGSWEKNHTKSSVRCLRWLRWPSKMSFLLRCLRYWGPFWIIETFLLRLIRLIRSFDILVWHFRSFYRILSIFAHFGKPHRPFCQSHAIKTNFKLKGKKIETIQQQKSHKLPRPFDLNFSVLTTDLTIRPECLRKLKENEGMMFVLCTQQYLFSHREEESGKTIGGGDQGTKLESPTYV